MNAPNVLPLGGVDLPLFEAPKQKTFRAAVAKTIRDLKAQYGLTNTELGEQIGCCADTISNAENENNDLGAVWLLRIAFHFGEAAIEPVRQLYLCRRGVPQRSVADRLRELAQEIEA